MHVVIEIALSMVGLYIIFSIINSALVEAYAQYTNKRGEHLKQSLDNFFKDDSGAKKNLADALYDHKLVKSFMKDEKKKPAYIEKNIFSQAFMEIVFGSADKSPRGMTKESLANANGILPKELEPTLQFLINKAEADGEVDMNKLQDEIETLYDSYMVRVSEWYKSKTKMFCY